MENCDEGKTNWMGDYFALIGNRVLYNENGNTRCKLALHLILNGNHKDGSRMLCGYVETVVDDAVKSWLSDDACKFVSCGCPIIFRAWAIVTKTSMQGELQWSLLDTSRKSEIESN